MNRVLLVHGMGRSPWSMFFLARRLRKAGLRPFLFGYSASVETFAGISARLARKIGSMGKRPWVAVGHSLGGLLLRSAIASVDPALRPLGLVTLGTPHHSPRLARTMKTRWYFRWYNGDCGQMLATPERMEQIPLPCVPTKAVIGTSGPRGRLSPFGDEENDGVVTTSEATSPQADFLFLPALHTFIMNHPTVIEPILELAGRPTEAQYKH